MRTVDLPLPKWERGYRTHGYWLGADRVGHVGLSPWFPGIPTVYTWGLDRVAGETGECSSLAAAKRRVEDAFRRHYSYRFPSSRDRGRPGPSLSRSR